MVSRAGVSVCHYVSPLFALRRAHNACVSISAQANSDGSGEARGRIHPAGVRWARWSWCGRGRRRELARAIHGCLPMNHNNNKKTAYVITRQLKLPAYPPPRRPPLVPPPRAQATRPHHPQRVPQPPLPPPVVPQVRGVLLRRRQPRSKRRARNGKAEGRGNLRSKLTF